MDTETRAPARPLYEAVTKALGIKGWSKTKLWRESGVARSTIEAWETQPRPPQAATVHAVADALDIDRSEALRLAGILTGEPPAAPTTKVASQALDELRAIAQRESKSIGDVLIERGLATREELQLSDEKRHDPLVRDILTSDLPEETKNILLTEYAAGRREVFREAGVQGKKRGPRDR